MKAHVLIITNELSMLLLKEITLMKIWKSAMAYLIAGLFFGVYFRELTKFVGFEGGTVLSTLHTHAITLGTMMSLIVLLFEGVYKVSEEKGFSKAWFIYQVGVWLLLLMNGIRGTLEVLGTPLSNAVDMSISGTAGIVHILLSIGFVYLLLVIRKSLSKHFV